MILKNFVPSARCMIALWTIYLYQYYWTIYDNSICLSYNNDQLTFLNNT